MHRNMGVLGVVLAAVLASSLSAEPPADAQPLERFAVAGDGDLLVVPVTFKGKTYSFMMDTGATHTLFDSSLQSLLGPRVESRDAAGTVATTKVDCYNPPEARVGKLPFRGKDVVAATDLAWVRRMTGLDIRGTLGMDFLGRYVVRIDFDAGLLTFQQSVGRPPCQPLPLFFDEPDKPAMEADVCGSGPLERFLVDTGFWAAESSADLQADLFETLRLLGKLEEVGQTVSESLGHRGYVSLSRLARLGMGLGEHRGLIVAPARASRLGLGSLSRYRVTFDFPGRCVYLEPGKRFHQRDDINRSGLYFNRHTGTTTVTGVPPSSPAATAGLKRGDVLVSIAGLSAEQTRLFALCKPLCATGVSVPVSVKRDGKQLSASLQLADWRPPVVRENTTTHPEEVVVEEPARAPTRSDAELRALVGRAIDAHGGRENLKRRVRYSWRGEGKVSEGGDSYTSQIEYWAKLPGKIRIKEEEQNDYGERRTVIAVTDEGRTWQSIDGVTRELPEKDTRPLDIAAYVGLLPLLDDPALHLSALPDATIGGRPVEGVRVSGQGHLSASLYFDKATHLLVMLACTLDVPGGKPVDMREYASDYQPVQGVQWAMKRSRVCEDSRRELRVFEVKLRKEIDDALFARP